MRTFENPDENIWNSMYDKCVYFIYTHFPITSYSSYTSSNSTSSSAMVEQLCLNGRWLTGGLGFGCWLYGVVVGWMSLSLFVCRWWRRATTEIDDCVECSMVVGFCFVYVKPLYVDAAYQNV